MATHIENMVFITTPLGYAYCVTCAEKRGHGDAVRRGDCGFFAVCADNGACADERCDECGFTKGTKKTHVTKRTDGKRWLQFAVIRDNAVTIMDLTPAAWGGWNLHSITQQDANDWPGSYTADAILAFKRANADACDFEITAEETAKALDLELRAPEIFAARAEVR